MFNCADPTGRGEAVPLGAEPVISGLSSGSHEFGLNFSKVFLIPPKGSRCRLDEFIDSAAGHDMTGISLAGGADLCLAGVIGVVDAAIDVAAAQPSLWRPRVEGVAALAHRTGPIMTAMARRPAPRPSGL